MSLSAYHHAKNWRFVVKARNLWWFCSMQVWSRLTFRTIRSDKFSQLLLSAKHQRKRCDFTTKWSTSSTLTQMQTRWRWYSLTRHSAAFITCHLKALCIGSCLLLLKILVNHLRWRLIWTNLWSLSTVIKLWSTTLSIVRFTRGHWRTLTASQLTSCHAIIGFWVWHLCLQINSFFGPITLLQC